MKKSVIIFSYSGHGYVVCDILKQNNISIKGYLEGKPKKQNPFNIEWLGHESEKKVIELLKNHDYFISNGNNNIRAKIQSYLSKYLLHFPINVIHQSAVISSTVQLKSGIMIAANVSINALVSIEDGAICNTGCIIEHECQIGEFAHIAPGAVLAGNVSVGEQTFVGANAVVKQGVKIGKNVIIGAGTVVIRDIPDNVTVVGNPQRIIKS